MPFIILPRISIIMKFKILLVLKNNIMMCTTLKNIVKINQFLYNFVKNHFTIILTLLVFISYNTVYRYKILVSKIVLEDFLVDIF